jgi:prophage regulatory protein
MVQTETSQIRRTIRRHQLREMVPLADSTIYEMEQRGEFPPRFALPPRCIVCLTWSPSCACASAKK